MHPETEPSTTRRAGARLTLRVEEPLIIVLSACPQDLVPINGGGPSDLVL
jgi:uncharacterized protein YcgI (DUF1989 family)